MSFHIKFINFIPDFFLEILISDAVAKRFLPRRKCPTFFDEWQSSPRVVRPCTIGTCALYSRLFGPISHQVCQRFLQHSTFIIFAPISLIVVVVLFALLLLVAGALFGDLLALLLVGQCLQCVSMSLHFVYTQYCKAFLTCSTGRGR